MPFVIPTVATGTESLVLDGLDLAQGNGGAIMLDQFTPPIPKKRPEWIDAADSDGSILARAPLVSNGEATIRVAVPGASRDDMQSAVGSIVDKLNEADKTPDGIPLVWTPSDSTASLTFYVLSGEVTEFPVDWESGYMANLGMVTMSLTCQPYGDGTPVVYTKAATAGPLITLDLTDVPGDARENTAILTITEASSQSRRTVEWGAEHLHHNPASPTSLVIDSDSLVTSGFAGTQTTLAGAYDPGAAGNSIITVALVTTPQAVCGTGTQPHVGCFRVKARINSGVSSGAGLNPGGDAYFRFAWRAGDGDYSTNTPTLSSTDVQGFFEIDLGLITIPEATAGTQTWDGKIEAWTPNSTGETMYVDYLMLIPVEAGYGKATASYTYTPGVIAGRDDFTGTTAAVALNARVAPSGGTWATSGVATDFVFEDAFSGEQVKRTTSTDASPRFAILGASTYTDTEVAVDTYYTVAVGRNMAVARFVDTSNYLYAAIDTTVTNILEIGVVVAGVTTVIASTAATVATANWYTVRIDAFASGRVIGALLNSAGGTLATVDGISSAVATGGALASGKVGFADRHTSAAPAPTRYYDNFVAAVPPSEPIVLYSGRSIAIRSDSTERESSAGGTWGRPQSYRGSRFKVQPAGSADRTTRVAVKASRNDLTVAEDANLTDTISLNVSVTPRYTVVPR